MFLPLTTYHVYVLGCGNKRFIIIIIIIILPFCIVQYNNPTFMSIVWIPHFVVCPSVYSLSMLSYCLFRAMLQMPTVH